ncbi:hypothetical protein [Chitinophaga qingshengii]|uniref:VCBS repeat-containing protein n=1 Tax=Chitinophaga qingshengii TaxID=1569794 RepID=A0ABR7TT25_9BACT|nr:hypothetical protein [Chitinophaga qingshengii]MBC9933183.1 hypothetical protein [Chitinophaga qingshengii]
MKILSLVFPVLLFCTAVQAQGTVSNYAYRRFIPSGCDVRDMAIGDLNGDQLTDLVLVLQSKKKDPAASRTLVILVDDPQHRWSLAASNSHLILPNDIGGAMGDPYGRITLDRGCITIEQSYGSREKTRLETTFCYVPAKKDWVLYKEVTTREDALNADAAKTTVLQGKQLRPISIKDYTGQH